MGKSDQKKTQNDITQKNDADKQQTNTGIADTQSRLAASTPQDAAIKNTLISNYGQLASDPSGMMDQTAVARLNKGAPAGTQNSGVDNPHGGSSGGSGGGGGGGVPGVPSYASTFSRLQGTNAGFDPTRLSNINTATGSLYDTSGNYGQVDNSVNALQGAGKNYGATDTAIGGLNELGRTGGVSSEDFANINQPTLTEFAATGGYNDAQKANLRARSNSAIASTYGNMKQNLDLSKRVAGNIGPGWSSAGFKLARQGAQDIGTQTQNTEAGIQDAVNANRMGAAGKLGDLNLGLQGIKTSAKLAGYTNAGNMDISKNQAIQDAYDKAGRLGLGKQAQIDAAKEAAAQIDLGTQGLISGTQLGAATGEAQHAASMAGIGASSAAAANALQFQRENLDATNQRFLIGEGDSNRNAGNTGLLNTYSAAPTDTEFNQSLLRGWGQDQATNSNNNINNRIGASTIPGIGSTISSGLGIAGQVMGLGAGGITGGFSNMLRKPSVPGLNSGGTTGTSMSGQPISNPYAYMPQIQPGMRY